jgi:plasmid stability protein
MPAIVMDNVPPEIYDQLQRRASARRRSVQDEAIDLLLRGLRQEAVGARLPDLIFSEEISPPCDLPRPGAAAPAPAHPGRPRLPDPLA